MNPIFDYFRQAELSFNNRGQTTIYSTIYGNI